jgi:hypothetical protein
MSTQPRRSRTFALMAATLVVTACATAQPTAAPKPIPNVAAIAGTWTGALDTGGGAQTCTLMIQPTGAATLAAQRATVNGSINVNDGKGTYNFPPHPSGTVTLYEDGGKRELVLTGAGGPFAARLKPKQ